MRNGRLASGEWHNNQLLRLPSYRRRRSDLLRASRHPKGAANLGALGRPNRGKPLAWTRKGANISLTVRGDNVGALTLLLKLRLSSLAQAIVAREFALLLVEMSFPPTAMHTPGLSHVVVDKLSRIHAPGGSGIANTAVHPWSPPRCANGGGFVWRGLIVLLLVSGPAQSLFSCPPPADQFHYSCRPRSGRKKTKNRNKTKAPVRKSSS